MCALSSSRWRKEASSPVSLSSAIASSPRGRRGAVGPTLRRLMYADELIVPWHDSLRELVPGIEPFDVDTHTGWKDPDGFSLRADRLIEALELIDGRAVVFTLADPDGYREANDRILGECAESGGRLVPFCRVDPRADPVAEAERALAAGARGIKLHPRAEKFRLADPETAPVFELAAERRLPVIVHAGR